jgi:hypothetical protein
VTPLVPDAERARQAVAVLRGYAYQLHLTVTAWMHLGDDDTLLLEVAEDYAIMAKSSLRMTQIKDTPSTTVTLRSDGVTKALASLWEFQKANPEHEVRLVYLTTSRIGRERRSGIPEGSPGIEYWRSAARTSDTTPLRELLLRLPLPTDLLRFVRDADDADLRRRLLSRVEWLCGAPGLEDARARLRDDLICRAADRKLLASDGEEALPLLLHQVLMEIVDGERSLTRASFERVFEEATTLRVSRTLARDRMGLAGSGFPIRMARAPSTGLVERPDVIDLAHRHLDCDGMVVLTGIGGSGKTEIASVLANDPRIGERFPDGVAWASFGPQGNVAAYLSTWISMIGLTPPVTTDMDLLMTVWRSAIQDRRLLVVADDVWQPGLVELLRPPAGCGYLVTSRDAAAAAVLSVEAIGVGALTQDEAIGLLEKRSGRILNGGTRADAAMLAERLGRIALAIVLAGALLRQGRDAAHLIEELAEEEIRLSALDNDAGTEPQRPPEERRGVSIEACLGLSVATLDDRHRAAFYRLAVLPGGELLDADAAAPILGAVSAVATSRLLSTLAARGLVTKIGSEGQTLYGVHDLLLEYARTGFGSGRRRVAPVPAELPGTLAELHQKLVERLAKGSATGRWADVNRAYYYNRYLPWHMTEANRGELLAALIAEEDDSGSPAWLVRLGRNGDTSGFLSAAARSFAAACADLIALPAVVPSEPVARAVGASTAIAILAAKASAIPIGILPALVRSGQMTGDEALTHAELAPGPLGLWLMAELLPLLTSARRAETWAAILEKAPTGHEFTILSEEEFLTTLLAVITVDERLELLQSLAALPHIVQARVLAQVYLWRRDEKSDRQIARFVAEAPAGRERAGWAAGVVHLASLGAPTGLDLGGVVEVVKSCGPHSREAKHIFLLLGDELASVIRGSTPHQLGHMLEPFERHRRPLPLPALLDGIAVAERETDAGNRALLLSRLCARIEGEAPNAFVSRALDSLLDLPDHDWRKAEGLGHVMKVAPSETKRRAEKAFVAAGAALGYGELGAMRLRVIVGALSEEAMRTILDWLPHGAGFDRRVTLPALLEHAPAALTREITIAIIQEAGTSGGIGDLHHAAERIPADLLPAIRDAVRLLPRPEFVEAIHALCGSGGLPKPLRTWLEASWSHLGAAWRLRISAILPPGSGHATAEQAVADIANHLAGRADPSFNGRLPLGAAAAVAATFRADDFRAAIRPTAVALVAAAPEDQLSVIASLGAHLEDDAVSALLSRIESDADPVRAARGLGALAKARPSDRRRLLERAAKLLGGNGDAYAAAIWTAEHAGVLNRGTALPLLELRKQAEGGPGFHELGAALYRLLPAKDRNDLEHALVSQWPLAPNFLAMLDLDSYPEKMQQIFDICRFSGGGRGAAAFANIFDDARRFLDADERVIEILLSKRRPAETALIALNLLRSAITLGIRDYAVVLSRLASPLRQILGPAGACEVGVSIAHAAALHAGGLRRT